MAFNTIIAITKILAINRSKFIPAAHPIVWSKDVILIASESQFCIVWKCSVPNQANVLILGLSQVAEAARRLSSTQLNFAPSLPRDHFSSAFLSPSRFPPNESAPPSLLSSKLAAAEITI